jgi:hypothetical protein
MTTFAVHEMTQSARLTPDGQIADTPVQPPSQKYFSSLLTQITCLFLAIPAHTKGRFAIVTNVGQGCDGREWRY